MQIRSFIVFVLCFGIFTLSAGTISAQSAVPGFADLTPGFIDANFKPVLGNPGGISNVVNRTIVLPSGKILVAGNIQVANGVSRNGIARYNSDGTLDTTFNTKSGATGGAINAIAVQSNGKIIIGGAFTSYAGQPVGFIARLEADGNLDVTFNHAGVGSTQGAGSAITEISVGADDRIYISGAFTTYNGTAINRLARLNVDGNLDTTFALGTGLASSGAAVIEQAPGGKILIGGFFTAYNGTTVPRFARINSDGSLDTTFVIGTGPVGAPAAIKVLPDDKILVAGGGATFNGVARNGIVRINSDGSVDTTFDAAVTGSSVTSFARQPDGKIILSGNFTAIAGTARLGIARIGADGPLDATFDPGTGLNAAASARSIALQADGKAVLVGNFLSYNGTARIAMAIVNTNGSLDTGAITSLTGRGEVLAMARQADGKILVGGLLSSVDGAPRANIARLNADGSNDPTFIPGTGANQLVGAIAIQADGKIIISGEFTLYNGIASARIARLNADGSLDASFNVGTGLDGGANSIALQSDGKVLIGGPFTSYNSVTATNRLARLNTDGTLDTGFNVGIAAANTVFKVVVQPDGKIVIGGDFMTFNTVPRSRIARLEASGAVDMSFDPGTGFGGRVKDLAVQADGKIVAVGNFPTFNAIPRVRAARLNSNGSLDTTFDPGVGFPNEVAAIQPLPDGKYLVVGNSFVTASGLSRNRIVRLKSNGSLDPKFVSGLGPAGSGVMLRAILPHDGKYLIGGTFDTFNTSARSSIVSISNTTKAPVDYDGDGKTDFAIARHYGGIGPWTYWIVLSGKGQIVTFDFGVFGVDGLQPADYDGDGMTDVAVWRGSAGGGNPPGYWIILSTTNSVKMIPFGQGGDFPLTEDYDGDGKDDLSTWRIPTAPTIGPGTWFYRGSFNNPTGNITFVPFGMRHGDQQDQADKPVPGDFDGDGKADFRVRRRVDLTNPNLNIPAVSYTLLTSTGNVTTDYFGWRGDRSVTGDYDGDGKIDEAIARGFNTSAVPIIWYIRYPSGIPDAQFQWGLGGYDQFAQGDYDGDGITDPTIYRRIGENNFYVLRSSDATMQVFHWGKGDEPCGPACDIAVATYNNR